MKFHRRLYLQRVNERSKNDRDFIQFFTFYSCQKYKSGKAGRREFRRKSGDSCVRVASTSACARHSLEQINKSWPFTTIFEKKKKKKSQVAKVCSVAGCSWK